MCRINRNVLSRRQPDTLDSHIYTLGLLCCLLDSHHCHRVSTAIRLKAPILSIRDHVFSVTQQEILCARFIPS